MKKKAISSFLTRNIREFALIVMILFVAAFVQIRTEGVFLSHANLSDLLREASILLMVSMGMMMVIICHSCDHLYFPRHYLSVQPRQLGGSG